MHNLKLLQDYIRTNGLEALSTNYAIRVNRSITDPGLILLAYNQIESPMHEPIVQTCRGIILDESNDWKCVARGYDKFFNHGEVHAAPIDWSSAKVYEKLDGSLINLHFHNGKWRVSTTGSCDAAGSVNDHGMSFAELFWKVWDELGYQLPAQPTSPRPWSTWIDEGICFLFELCTPLNQIVVRHGKNRLVLHGARDKHTQKEIDPAGPAETYGWECVKRFDGFEALEHVLTHADGLNGFEQEGFVVCDANFNRVKIKARHYVNLHHIKSNITTNALIDIVRKGEQTEVISYFPEFKEYLGDLTQKYVDLLVEMCEAYDKICDIPEQKDFAAEALRYRFSDCLFQRRAKGIGVNDWMLSRPLDKVKDLMGLKKEILEVVE